MSEQTTETTTPDEPMGPPPGAFGDLDPLYPDNPLVEGAREYSVRLVYRVMADNPEHARLRYIQMCNEFGMTNWTYRVTDVVTDEEFLVNDGVVLTPEEFEERMAADEAAENAVETVVDPDDRV